MVSPKIPISQLHFLDKFLKPVQIINYANIFKKNRPNKSRFKMVKKTYFEATALPKAILGPVDHKYEFSETKLNH